MTTEAKHTPGPWFHRPEELHEGKHRVAGRCPSVYTVIDGKAFGIADALRIQVVPPGRDDIAEANARLIAAAPDLLEACRKALTCASINSDVAALIRAAITKAEHAREGER